MASKLMMLRRATSFLLPLAIRTVGSPRTFRNAISTAPSSLNSTFSRSTAVPFQRFSSKPSSDENLIKVLQSEIECAEQPAEESIPDGFPFKIQDNPGERTVLLTREYQDETIKVEVDMPTVDGGNEEEDGDENEIEEFNYSIPLVVSITKGDGACLEFGITALPDEIHIDSLSIKKENSEDELAYNGPDFDELDENLQKAFYKYLEIRGIKPSTTHFLHEYMANKDSKEYLQWLNNLKKFMEK